MATKKLSAKERLAALKGPPKKSAQNVKPKAKATKKRAVKKATAKKKGKKQPKGAARKEKISIKDQQFADYYMGGPDNLRGNATACYRYMHPTAKETTCQQEGSTTLNKPMVQAYIEARVSAIQDVTGINAAWVLDQSVRLLRMGFGDIASPHEAMVFGTKVKHTLKTFNPNAVKSALELIGKNITVKAFQENVEVTHNFDLEQLLNDRSKAVEKAAADRKLAVVGGTEA